MTIVSNASPLIALLRIGQLDLLRQLYSEIIIPEAVWHEVVVEGADQPGAEAVSSAQPHLDALRDLAGFRVSEALPARPPGCRGNLRTRRCSF